MLLERSNANGALETVNKQLTEDNVIETEQIAALMKRLEDAKREPMSY